jgi:hypothetical protein
MLEEVPEGSCPKADWLKMLASVMKHAAIIFFLVMAKPPF